MFVLPQQVKDVLVTHAYFYYRPILSWSFKNICNLFIGSKDYKGSVGVMPWIFNRAY